jgi:TDG/mug DNA glycosylase family protein
MDRDTVGVYEANARTWQERRKPHHDRARAFARTVTARATDGPVADLGCGPGWYTNDLGPSAIAVDAAGAMLDLVPQYAPGAPRVQADLARLPFRRGSLGAAFASKSYVHLPRRATPLALHDLHRSLAVGALAEIVVFGGDTELDRYPNDDFPGRSFSAWPEQLLRDVIHGAGFTIEQFTTVRSKKGDDVELTVRAERARTLADTVGARMHLLVCGLNPSLYAADVGAGFARPGNRFWPAAIAAGLVSRDRDPMHALTAHGVGMTDLVKRASPRADELTADEYRDGLARIERLAAWLQPAAVCFVGLAGWRAAVDRKATTGVQDRTIGGRPVYVMPNTSGVNASSSLDDLAGHLRAARELAGQDPPVLA